MKNIKPWLCMALLSAVLVMLPSFALANPTGARGILAANGTAVTVADPSTDVSNEVANPKDINKTMWRHDAVLQNTVNGSGGRHALVYWQAGTHLGQPVNSYIYMSENDSLFGGGTLNKTGNASITQTGGRLGFLAGGGYNSNLDGSVSIAISGGQCGVVLGGGVADVNGADARSAVVTGRISITASGGLIGTLFGGGAAEVRATASAGATSNVVGGVSITLSGDVKLVGGAALGGFAESSGNTDAQSSVQGSSTMNINLPVGSPGQYVLNLVPNSPIVIMGGAGASSLDGSGAAIASLDNGVINLNSGTINGMIVGGGAVSRERGGSAKATTTSATINQTGGFVLPASGQGGAIFSGGVTVLPLVGGQPDISQAQYVDESVTASSVRISGGMAIYALANGVVLGQTGVYSYAPTEFIRTYANNGIAIVTGGSVKSAAGRIDATSQPPGLYSFANNPSITVVSPTLANNATPVYRTAMLLHNACGGSLAACTPHKNQPVTQLGGSAASYGMKDVYTDNASAANEAGGIYAWLPLGSRVSGAVSGGSSYQYQLTHPDSDANYSDVTAGSNLTWMVLRGALPPAPPTPPAPRTGVDSLVWLWVGLALLSIAGITVFVVSARKRKQK